MKFKLNKEIVENILTYTISGLILVVFYFLFKNIDVIIFSFKEVIRIIMPFVFGFCIAFIVFPLVTTIESRVLEKLKLKPKTKRIISVFFGVLTVILIVSSFFAILIPQLYFSFNTLTQVLPGYFDTAKNFIDDLIGANDDVKKLLETILSSSESELSNYINKFSGFLPSLINYSYSVIQTIANIFIGLIIAVYILLDKERFSLQIKKLLYAFLPDNFRNKLIDTGHLTAKMFNQFIFGKALDSLIVGILCFIVLSLGNFPYALLISFIIGITNMIPVFGPFIGAIPCTFILLIIDPIKAAWFVLFILILQQIDGNIIGPYILGDSMGLPSLWIMFAIIFGGGLFGIVGMFIGIPVFSVIYIIVKQIVEKKLTNKNLIVK